MEQKRNLSVMEDASEIIHFKDAAVPLYVSDGRLSAFSGMEMLCHWHEELEYIQVVSGRMLYDINGKKWLLEQGDSVLINARQMHYGCCADGSDCEYRCILFHPRLLTGNTGLQQKYVDPITECAGAAVLFLPAAEENHWLRPCFHRVYEAYRQGSAGCELEIVGLLSCMWARWYESLQNVIGLPDSMSGPELSAQRQMVEFVYRNYRSRLTLSDIAKAGGLCRSGCCRSFQKYLQKSPMVFLNQYRLRVGVELLQQTGGSITEIAYACGFNSSSYFAELFLKNKGCSPREFRRRQRAGLREEISDN